MQHAKVVLDEYIDCSVKSLSIRSMERYRLYVLVEVLLIASEVFRDWLGLANTFH